MLNISNIILNNNRSKKSQVLENTLNHNENKYMLKLVGFCKINTWREISSLKMCIAKKEKEEEEERPKREVLAYSSRNKAKIKSKNEYNQKTNILQRK